MRAAVEAGARAAALAGGVGEIGEARVEGDFERDGSRDGTERADAQGGGDGLRRVARERTG